MVLEMMLDGKLYPAEQIVVTTEKYKNIQYKASQLMQELEQALGPAERTKLEDYLAHVAQANCCIAEEYLKYGLALGVRLMKEVEEIPYFQNNE